MHAPRHFYDKVFLRLQWLFIPTIPKDGACYGNLKLASEDTYLGVAGDGNNQHLVVGTNKYDWEIIFEQTYIRQG